MELKIPFFFFEASVGKLSNPPSSQLCVENLSVERALLHPVFSPSDTLRGRGRDALENLNVRGKAQAEIAAAWARVSAVVLASQGILQRKWAVFILSLSLSPSFSLLLSASPFSGPITKGLQDYCMG